MKCSMKKGFSFGLMSGVITSIGIVVGINSGTHSTIAVIVGLLIVAISDAFSDALGVHVAEECEHKHSAKQIWVSTFATFTSKFVTSITFVFPLLIWPLQEAITICIGWGLALISIFSFWIARQQHDTKPYKAVTEHVALAIFVVFITHYMGYWISTIFHYFS